jgi:hypothetical protein
MFVNINKTEFETLHIRNRNLLPTIRHVYIIRLANVEGTR